MVILTNLLLSAGLAAVGLGSALPPKIGTTVLNEGHTNLKGRTSIPQVRNPNYQFNGALSVYKTYLKYGAPVPDHLLKAVANVKKLHEESKRGTGSAAAIPIDEFDVAYVTPVTIGTPPQTLNLDFDTGSSDLWVFSNHMPVAQIRGQEIYSPNKSSSSKLLSGHSWSITYGDGSASRGNVYTDNFTVGGVTALNQAVECAQQVSTSFTRETHIDGLVGLGFAATAGTYDFGYIDKAKYTDNITYTPINTNPGYWTWTSPGYAVGSGEWQATTITNIADTGTTLLYLPNAIVTKYYSQIPGATNNRNYGGYVFPCTATVPSFTFGVGSAKFTIPGNYINYGKVSAGSTTCFGGIQSSSGVGINIFGDVALKAAFVVFDAGPTPQIGWATKPLKL